MDTKLRCIIVDDEPLARELIRSYVSKTPGLTLVNEFESAGEAASSILGGEADVVFMDIDMPVLNGIEFGAMVPASTRIIYITAYDQYALDGFRVNALDYLLKPVSYADFARAVTKAIEWHTMRRASSSPAHAVPETLTVKSDYRLVQMRLDTIRYVEVRNDRVIFYRSEGEPVSSLMSMRDIEELLPADRFMRVHRSFIVNLPMVEVVERGRIVFGKTYIPISDSRRDEFLERLRSI